MTVEISSGQVVAATTGVEAIYWVDPPAESADPLDDYARATDAITAAVTQNAISRVVFQSSVGAEKRHGAGEIDGLAATETALDDLGVDVVHLRCGYFFTNLMLDLDAVRAGHLRTLVPVDRPMSWVAPRDIAEVATFALLSDYWTGRRVQAVHGPQDLSWSEVAQILSTETGREVCAEQVPDSEMRRHYAAAGLSVATIDAIMGMSTGLRDGFVAEQQRSVVSTTPTTLRSWVTDVLIPAV